MERYQAKVSELDAALLSVATVGNLSMFHLICYVLYDVDTWYMTEVTGSKRQQGTVLLGKKKSTLICFLGES